MKHKRKIKLNYAKIVRNLFLLFILCCIVYYCKTMKIYNKTIQKNVAEFTRYAKEKNISLTQENYRSFINK